MRATGWAAAGSCASGSFAGIRRQGTLRFRLGGGQVTDLFLGAEGKTLISNTDLGARAVQVWDVTTGDRCLVFFRELFGTGQMPE